MAPIDKSAPKTIDRSSTGGTSGPEASPTPGDKQKLGEVGGASTTSGAGAPQARSLHPSVGDGYEVSDPRMRLPVDRAGADLPPKDATLDAQLKQELTQSRLSPRGPSRDGRETGVGNGLNEAGGSLRSASGSIPREDWDHPERIVGRLTQNPAQGVGEDGAGNSAYRCAPSNLFAASLMNGPEAGARFLDRAAEGAGARNLSAGDRRELGSIADKIRDKSASFDDLSRAQGLLYEAGNTEATLFSNANQALSSDNLNAGEKRQLQSLLGRLGQGGGGLNPAQGRQLEALLSKANGQRTRARIMDDEHHPGDESRQYWGVPVGGRTAGTDRSGFNDREVRDLAALGGGDPSTDLQLDYGVSHPMEDLVSRLQPGQATTVRVAPSSPEGDEFAADPSHFVTVGKRPDGTPYLYNSDPAQGDHTLFTGRPGQSQPQNFVDELRRYDSRISTDQDGDNPRAVTATFE